MKVQTSRDPLLSPATAMVRVDALRNVSTVVDQLGGAPAALLAKAGIDPAILSSRHALVPYLSLVELLRLASIDLACSDFGMRLAAAQESTKVLGPLEVAIRNCPTIRSAFEYCSAHTQVYSNSARIIVEDRPDGATTFLRFHVHIPQAQMHPQTVEHALLLAQLGLGKLSAGRLRAPEIWFTHPPLSDIATYCAFFGATVKFQQKLNGMILPTSDIDADVPGADPQLFDLANYFIETNYPPDEIDLIARVGALIWPLLQEGRCTHGEVATALGIHPRTLQRRLTGEGESFETIRDAVRRDTALRYLKQTSLPLIRVAAMLGYTDPSVLTRSCYRWFSASPRQIRAGKVMCKTDVAQRR